MKVCEKCDERYQSREWRCPRCGESPGLHAGFISFVPEVSGPRESFPSSSFEKLAEIEGKNFWFISRNELISWAFRKHFPEATTFLEIGCGTGFVLSSIGKACAGLALTGADGFTEALGIARRRIPSATLFQMDCLRIPFENEFDVVAAFDVLEHIDDDEAVLSQVGRATKPGGGIIVTVPQHPKLWSPADDYSRHKRRYTRKDLKDKIQRAGFVVEGVTSFVTLLLPLMLISRMKRAEALKDLKDFNPFEEFKISSFTNTVARGIMGIERLLIKAGLSLPAGGSLLLVARKPGK